MRKIMIILFPLCILYFVIGIILVWTNVIPQQYYLNGAGIVGGIASVLALFSFLRPVLTTSDLKALESDSLHKLAEVSNQIKQLEDARSRTTNAITDLAKQKKEMELLVRKASMSLFLREQCEHYQEKVLNHLQTQPSILKILSEYQSSRNKLNALDEEIKADDNVELLQSILAGARRQKSLIDEMIDNAHSPILKGMLQVFRVYAKILQ
jgi:hypothetical protein